MSEAKQGAEVHQYQAEMQKLLDILVHSLYTEREIFLRELISNASDALSKVQFEALTQEGLVSGDQELEVRLAFDDTANTLEVIDNGCGLTKQELIDNLGTIASSGTLKFLKQAQESQQSVENLIGQFGVGFYSVFMVADRVELVTRSWKEDEAGWMWSSDGSGSYTLTPMDVSERGTRVKLFLKEDAKEFCAEYRMESIVKRYSNYVPFPVKIKDRVLNQVKALWTQSRSSVEEAEYEEFYKHIAHEMEGPLHTLHFSIDAPLQFHALLFFPKKVSNEILYARESRGIALYAQKVLIQPDNKNLLPPYLRFVQGVVDSEDLPLNVSRESVQQNALIERIKKSLTSRVLKELQTLADQHSDTYLSLWKAYGSLLKEGAAQDFGNREKLMDLLRFNSTICEDAEPTVTLKDYVSRMRDGQKEIYYALGSTRESLLYHPNLEYFKKQGLEVLFLLDQIDEFVMTDLREYDGKPFKSISQADIENMEDVREKPETELSDEEKSDLLSFFKEQLGERVQDVVESKRLVGSPCSLIDSRDGMSAQMERMMKMMNQEVETQKRTLELNLGHPVMQNLSTLLQKQKSHEFLPEAVEQLYLNALLVEGLLENPVEMLPRINRLLADASAFQLKDA